MSEEKRETSVTVALGTKDDFILFFRERRVFRVDILHDGANLLGIHCPQMLKPNNPAVYSTKIAVGSNIVGDFLQSYIFLIEMSFFWVLFEGKFFDLLECNRFVGFVS